MNKKQQKHWDGVSQLSPRGQQEERSQEEGYWGLPAGKVIMTLSFESGFHLDTGDTLRIKLKSFLFEKAQCH